MHEYLTSTEYFNFEHEAIQAFSEQLIKEGMSEIEKAVALYYGVRDGIRYNPYVFSPVKENFTAAHCLGEGQSYCIPKAILLAAVARLNGIPARIGLADVKNHLSSPGLVEWLKSDVFVMHGYTEMYLQGKWVKATPAFDKKLCGQMGVLPLEFNGLEDSIFHEHNGEGARHMEYLADHGQFSEVPFELIVDYIAKAYPHLAENYQEREGHSLEADLN